MNHSGRHVKVIKSERFPKTVGVEGRAVYTGFVGSTGGGEIPPGKPIYLLSVDNQKDMRKVQDAVFTEDELQVID